MTVQVSGGASIQNMSINFTTSKENVLNSTSAKYSKNSQNEYKSPEGARTAGENSRTGSKAGSKQEKQGMASIGRNSKQ